MLMDPIKHAKGSIKNGKDPLIYANGPHENM